MESHVEETRPMTNYAKSIIAFFMKFKYLGDKEKKIKSIQTSSEDL